jgi:phospholipid/cholesterol/gamma-HCH transport system substrate-binding protein
VITRRDRVVVGLFVVGTSAILVSFLGLLWGIQASTKMKRYYLVTDSSVSGLTKSAAVKYLGVDAGKVEKMEFDDSTPPKVKITLAVSENTPVKEDTQAQLTPVGITGIQIIELVRGASKKDLPPGREIPYLPSKLTDIITKFDRLSGAVDVFFGENKDKLAHTIDNVNTLLETATAAVSSSQAALDRISRRVDDLLDEKGTLHEVLARASAAIDDAGKLVREANDKHAIDEVLGALADTRKAIGDLDRAVNDIRGQLGQTGVADTIADVRSTARAATEAASAARDLVQKAGGGAQDDLEAAGRLLEQLRRTVRDVEQLSHEVRERPALLVRDLEQPHRKVVDK